MRGRPSGLFEDIAENVQKVVDFFRDLGAKVMDAIKYVGDLLERAGTFAGEVWDSVLKAVEAAAGVSADLVGKAGNWLGDTLIWLLEWLLIAHPQVTELSFGDCQGFKDGGGVFQASSSAVAIVCRRAPL